MESLDRPMLMRKPMAALKSIIRQMGADSPANETKDSLIHRILLFAPQKQNVLVKPKLEDAVPLTEQELTVALLPYLNQGLSIKYQDGTWEISYENRADSGTMAMPLKAVVRCAQYLMRVAV
jgi:hypothetical protein